jgi:hypothetical protein
VLIVFIFRPEIKELTIVPRRQRNGGSFVAFCIDKNWGRKNGPTRKGTLGQANAKT